MASPAYEQAKAQYWNEREARQKAFADSAEGKSLLTEGGFHEAFAKSEKPYVKAFKEREPEHKRAEAAVAKTEQAEGKAPTDVGPRGGQFYTSPSGAKVYLKSNPGAIVMGQNNPLAAEYNVQGTGPWKAVETALDKILK